MPYKKRRIYPETNRSNSIGPIMFPSFTSEEAHNVIPWKEKKDFYSAAAKVACRVGGPSPEGSTDVERKPETMEPGNVPRVLRNRLGIAVGQPLHHRGD